MKIKNIKIKKPPIRAEMLGFVELIPQGPMKASREGETRSQLD